MNRRTLSLAATAATLITAPASAALAAQPPAGPAPPAHGTLGLTLPGPHDTVSAKLQAAARPELVEDVVRLTHKRERLHGRKARRGLRQELSTWTPARLRAHKRALRHEIRERRRAIRRERARERAEARAARRGTATNPPSRSGRSTASPALQAIAACESGGNPGAVDASGTYRGKYQFDLQTWRAVGGSGDPAAAPEAEQDRRAAALYSRAGASPWPVCGR